LAPLCKGKQVTIAQVKAARRKFRQYYRKDGPIGQPRYKRKSIIALDRREQMLRERQREMQARKGKKK
jgi:hypothetical protein